MRSTDGSSRPPAPRAPTRKDEAEALAIALELEAVSIATVVAWADRCIERDPAPEPSLCELALMGQAARADVASTLRSVTGSVEPSMVMARACRWITDALERSILPPEAVSKWLFFSASYGTGPGGLYSEAWDSETGDATHFWDALDLARDRAFGDPADVTNEMLAFLLRFSERRLGPPPSLLRGWTFETTETSANGYRVVGVDEHGRSVESSGTDPESVLRQCQASAANIVRQAHGTGLYGEGV